MKSIPFNWNTLRVSLPSKIYIRIYIKIGTNSKQGCRKISIKRGPANLSQAVVTCPPLIMVFIVKKKPIYPLLNGV